MIEIFRHRPQIVVNHQHRLPLATQLLQRIERIQSQHCLPGVRRSAFINTPEASRTELFFACMQPGDTYIGLDLRAGGHLTHGARPAMSGKWFNAVQYGVREADGLIDHDEVEVFARSKGALVKNLVTDPYSTSLALNSTRSQLVDLNDAALKPVGWDTLKKPELQAFEDIVLYELHVRDFSINDPTVPAAHRGTYLAFTDTASSGMTHLQKLAQAGLSHLHLMPLADFSTVQEDRSQQVVPQIPSGAAPDAEAQQAALLQAMGKDAFDWGYDPFHYSAPEGSYAMEASGSARILEVRKMVQSLAQVGLRVVMEKLPGVKLENVTEPEDRKFQGRDLLLATVQVPTVA